MPVGKQGRFLALAMQFRFAEALACLDEREWQYSGWAAWVCYRQGLFNTVNNWKWNGRSLPAGFASAVSLAAVGRTDEAADVARLLCKHPVAPVFRTPLAAALAPYAPVLAKELLQGFKGRSGLKAVLEARHGDPSLAREWLANALQEGAAAQDAELNLLASNWLENEPERRLARLNAYLASFGLAPLALKNPELPPLVNNLRAAQPLPKVEGPLVSVLMTAYNTEDRINAAIEGVLSQTYQNIELVVCDDASTDATAAVVQAWARQDARVKYVRMPANAGTYMAKTRAFEVCRGEFVTCHDSDDWSHPQRLERQVAPLLKNHRLVATTSQWIRVEDDGQYYARLVYHMRRLNPSSPLFRRELVKQQAGLWDAVRIGADSEFHSRLRLVFGRRSVRSLPMPFTIGAHRENSLMTAQDTGYTPAGMSPVRLAYWESWARWHIQSVRAGLKPKMPDVRELVERPFEAPAKMTVPHTIIEHVFSSLPPVGPANHGV